MILQRWTRFSSPWILRTIWWKKTSSLDLTSGCWTSKSKRCTFSRIFRIRYSTKKGSTILGPWILTANSSRQSKRISTLPARTCHPTRTSSFPLRRKWSTACKWARSLTRLWRRSPCNACRRRAIKSSEGRLFSLHRRPRNSISSNNNNNLIRRRFSTNRVCSNTKCRNKKMSRIRLRDRSCISIKRDRGGLRLRRLRDLLRITRISRARLLLLKC